MCASTISPLFLVHIMRKKNQQKNAKKNPKKKITQTKNVNFVLFVTTTIQNKCIYTQVWIVYKLFKFFCGKKSCTPLFETLNIIFNKTINVILASFLSVLLVFFLFPRIFKEKRKKKKTQTNE